MMRALLARCARTGASAARLHSAQKRQRCSLGPGGSRASVGISHADRLGHTVDSTSRITRVGKCPRKSCVNKSSCRNNTAVPPAQHPAAEGEPDGVLLILPCREGTVGNDVPSLHPRKPPTPSPVSVYKGAVLGLGAAGL